MTAEKPLRAVIDIGTNSMRLLIYRFDAAGALQRTGKWVQYTRMGEGVDRTGRLGAGAIARNLKALRDFVARATAQGVALPAIAAFATSAVRDAENGADFCDAARRETGVNVRVIDGETEAAYGFAGVSQCFEGRIFICDIGGGSTELILGADSRIETAKSLNMGCVRATEKWLSADPPSRAALEAVEAATAAMLSEALPAYDLAAPYQLVGIGGTATTLTAIKQRLADYDRDAVHLSRLTAADVEALQAKLAAMPLAARKKVAGLAPGRADIILAGTAILKAVMKACRQEALVICDNDNLEGAALLMRRGEG
jgi:exopolyphosphatase/guanosine-5'-triphosphate,3'-diphosphate pyrophosphatase